MADEMILTEEERQREIERLSEEVNKLQLRIKEQLSEIAELHKKNTDIYKEIGTLEQSLAETENRLQEEHRTKEQLEAEHAEEEGKIAEREKRIEKLSTENDQLRRELEEQTASTNTLKEQLFQMENSKSWKITKPLRTLLWKHHDN